MSLFWNGSDLERKLEEFRQYYNSHRVHTSLDGDPPSETSGEAIIHRADLSTNSGGKPITAGYISCP